MEEQTLHCPGISQIRKIKSIEPDVSSRPLALSPVMNTFALNVFDYSREGISRSWHRNLLSKKPCCHRVNCCVKNDRVLGVPTFVPLILRKLTESFLLGLGRPENANGRPETPALGSRDELRRGFHCLLPTVVSSARSFYCGTHPLPFSDHKAGSSFRNVVRFGFRLGSPQSRLGQKLVVSEYRGHCVTKTDKAVSHERAKM